MDLVFVLATVAVVPFWLLLLVAPTHPVTAKTVHAVTVFAVLGVLYFVVLSMAESATAANLLTLDGYKELQADDAAVVAGWVHYLSLDLFAAAWLVRDSTRVGLARPVVVVCVLLTFVLAPLGLAAYLLVRARRTGLWSLEVGEPSAAA